MHSSLSAVPASLTFDQLCPDVLRQVAVVGAVERLGRLVGERHHVPLEDVHHVTRLVVRGGVQAGTPAVGDAE